MTDLIKQVENDEITDITPYLENEEFLKELAKKGLLYDQYIDTKYVDVLITLITNRYAQEYYHILAYHENIDVRYTLAENGYELDILSQDEDPDVLTAVLYSDDSYIPNYLTRKSSHQSEWYIVRGYLRHQRNPKLQYLKLFLETPIPEEANKDFQEFKTLQQEWKEIKAIPAEKANELWRNYQLYVEQYYDLLNLNREAREYDFKKNLEKKTQLCEAAEKLADESDVISAFHQLQDLHQEYRETGPVEKELREQVWQRFKAASTVINKRHQQHFEEIRAEEEENLVKKTALCEKIEDIVKQERKNTSDWDSQSKEIIALQQEWKTIGFTPQKMNTKIFERFRAACDEFFTKKGEYFKELKEKYAENAKRKQELVEKAQALKDSTDWKKTSDKLIALQKEWKTIGMVPKRLGDQLWEDFLAACNHFFEARNAVHADERNEERENLAKKNEIIEKLKQLAEGAVENLQEEMRKLTDEFNSIGHVPFKEKDKMFKEYHETLDKLYKTLNIKASRRRMDNFRNNLKKVAQRGENAIDNERGRLMRRFEQLKQEINTYENNLGFLNISSKKGNSLIDDMNRRVQKLKDELAETKQKIKTIDAEKKD